MSPQAGWILQEEIAPRIAGAVPRSILCVGAEDSQELVQDGITLAAKMVDRLEQQGRLDTVTPGNVAYYTLQHLKSGRRANAVHEWMPMAQARNWLLIDPNIRSASCGWRFSSERMPSFRTSKTWVVSSARASAG